MGKVFAKFTRLALTAGVAAIALTPASSQQANRTVARYTMDAGTLSGMAAMQAGGGRGGLGSIMNAMRGGNQTAHELVLRLGSTRAAANALPAADHFMPQGAGLGASVPLITPRRVAGESAPPTGEMPRGRLLLFWGCGEHAGVGQPVIIDFAQMARGQVPPGLYAQGLNLPEDWRVLVSNSSTYGDWPNGESSQSLTATSSLLGAHRVAGNYSPEISFNLAQDFMPALNPSVSDLASGAGSLRWNGLDQATGYYAWSMGAGQNERDMVWWTSSSSQAFGGPFSEWISPTAAARYVQAGQLMAPGTTQCAIPAEVRAAGSAGMMTSLYAYGPQVDFSYPARPARAARGWQPEWITRVRFRSMAMVIPGMAGLGSSSSGEATPAPQATPARPRCRGGLRGIAERAAGLCD
jgi:hypothetical protein